MSRYKFRNPIASYFITISVQQWVDLFSRPVYRHILLKNLRYCQNHKGLVIHAWVIMTNHLHLIVRSEGNHSLPLIMRDFKKHCSKELYAEIAKHPKESRRTWLLSLLKQEKGIRLWQFGNHPIELFNTQVAQQKLNYLHLNPVKAEIVEHPEEYLYSSARDYVGKPGLLEVEMI